MRTLEVYWTLNDLVAYVVMITRILGDEGSAAGLIVVGEGKV